MSEKLKIVRNIVLSAVLLVGVFCALVMVMDNSKAQDRSDIKYEFSQNSEEEGDKKMWAEHETPNFKIFPISSSVAPLFRALLERVWVTKYFGMASEIFKTSSDMPLCNTLPNPQEKRGGENGVFLWNRACLPVEVRWNANKENMGGTAIVRMLDFGSSTEVLDEVFEIIKTDSLGMYRISEDKKNAVQNLIKEESRDRFVEPPLSYKHFFKTYFTLEGRYFLDVALTGDSDITNEPEDMRRFFTHRGKKHALSIHYNSEDYKQEEGIVEYSLSLPIGFFGIEDKYKKGKILP